MQHCKPIKAVRLLMRRHHEWISSFSTNFVAAVLGIALTFGTTMWYENQKKREAAEALVENCLQNMQDRLKQLDAVIEMYDKQEQLFAQVSSQPLDSLSDDLLSNLIYEYTHEIDLLPNHSFEKSFSQSVTSHEILGQYAGIIGEGFECLLYVEAMHADVNKMKNELLKKQILERNTYWDKGSIKEVVAGTLGDPFFVYFQDWFAKRSQMVHHMHDYLHYYVPEAQRLWSGEITHEEFRDETRQRWDSWHR